jgi:hypothetical protein
MTGFFFNRNGDLSFFRIGILIAVVGGLMLIGAVVFTASDQAAFRTPLEIELPTDTQQVGEEALSPISRRLYFESTLSPEAVAVYYDTKLAEFLQSQGVDPNDPNRDRCLREPRDDNYQGYVPGNGTVPYEFRCLFQQVSLSNGIDKSTLVIIQPGVRNDAAGTNYEGTTRIEYEQYWQP